MLAARGGAGRAGRRPGAGQVRRMVLAVARYLVRMRGRATPFGVFADVAPLAVWHAGVGSVDRLSPDSDPGPTQCGWRR